ncbi:ATP-binding protein [Myxococcus stipitatus]|uniref:ATP-binding protein n=1 Tax=Myxococcus stipitatus TaxID=83455 RepID=UPI0030CF964F
MSGDDSKAAPAPQRLADLLRKAMTQAREKPAAGLAELEANWKQREVAQRQAEAAERARYEAAHAAAWPRHLQLCHAPAEAVEAFSSDKVLETAALRAARHVSQEGLRTLLLSGGAGVGKTVGACHLFRFAVRYVTRAGQQLPEWDASAGLYVGWSQLRRAVDPGAEDARLLQRALQVRVLVLDDIGGLSGEELGPRHRELLEELIETRDKPGMVTAYTTNLSVQRREGATSDFAAHVGTRLVSRMSRQGTFHLADCGTRDLRRK